MNQEAGTLFRALVLVTLMAVCLNALASGTDTIMNSTEKAIAEKTAALLAKADDAQQQEQYLNAFNFYLAAAQMLNPGEKSSYSFIEFSSSAFDRCLLWVDTLLSAYGNVGSKLVLARFIFPLYEKAITIKCLLYRADGEHCYLESALLLAEKSKSLLVADALKNSAAGVTAGIPKQLSDLDKELVSQMVILRNNLEYLRINKGEEYKIKLIQDSLYRVQERSDSLQYSIKQQYSGFRELLRLPLAVCTDSVRKILLHGKCALAEFFYGDRGIYIFWITPEADTFFRVESDKMVRANIMKFQQGLIRHNWDDYTSSAHALFAAFILPAGSLLKEITSVRIIPDGQVNFIPFECLLMKEATAAKGDYKSLDYLLKRFSVSYGASAAILIESNKKQHKESSGRIYGLAPVFSDEMKKSCIPAGSLDVDTIYLNLPEQRWSARLMEHLNKEFRGEFYSGTDANAEVFRRVADSGGIIHLASHSIFDDQQPMNSRLVFARIVRGDSLADDGYIYAWQLFAMQINSPLVVLGSCRTGFGQFRKCEGLSGIASGFSFAGCPALIYTLWEVDEKETNTLMQLFYTGIGKRMSPDLALHQAKLDYLASATEITANPYYWAGVVFSGEPAKIVLIAKTSDRIIFFVAVPFVIISILLSWLLFFRRKRSRI